MEACRAAEAVIGPLRLAGIDDPDFTHRPGLAGTWAPVVTENWHVRQCVDALGTGDLEAVGRLMTASHVSLRDDYAVSTPTSICGRDLVSTTGVYGARLTGAGFGGCVIALAEPGAVRDGWVVAPSTAEVVSDRSNYYPAP